MSGRPKLTKSGFLDWKDCPKSFWLSVHRPDVLAPSPASAFDRMLAADGAAVEDMARRMVGSWADAGLFRFQVPFDCGECHARADMIRFHPDGDIDIYEVKSSTSLRSGARDHRVDAAFQLVVAERCGLSVSSVFVVHLDPAFVRSGEVDPSSLLLVADVTSEVRAMRERISADIEDALTLLRSPRIDGIGCPCRHASSAARRCRGFRHLNPDVPQVSAHLLPRISRSRLERLDREGRLAMAEVTAKDVTAAQLPVLRAFAAGSPVVDVAAIRRFLGSMVFPIAYYDYEAFGSAVPAFDGVSPHQQIPFQFSLHVEQPDGGLEHHEFLSDAPGGQGALVDALHGALPPTGTIVSWNAPYEKSCNGRLAALLPHHADFLADVDERTIDLMLPFRDAYVDARFGGSTSIKMVLPVLVPDLSYGDGAVQDGAAAMETWRKMVGEEDALERCRMRRDLLAYCCLDSLAMVRIVRFLRATLAS